MIKLYKELRLVKLAAFTLMFLANSLNAQTFLEVPVKLEIEKGDLDNVVVKVKKDGKDAFTQSVASKMRFKFDFNRKYTLVFTKPGYITKTIEINSKAPAARISQGFDPYQIGIKLFKQGEENKIVYNQAVAHIKYDQNLDEFNFDTDYSKSILSAINLTDDNEIKSKGSVINKEVQNIGNSTSTSTSTQTDSDSNSENLTSLSDASPSLKNNIRSSINQENDVTKPFDPQTANDFPSKSNLGNGNGDSRVAEKGDVSNQSKNLKGKNGKDSQKKSFGNPGAENKKISVGNSDKETTSKKLVTIKEFEYPNKFLTKQSGIVFQNDTLEFMETKNINREDIIEKNRVITKVKIKKGKLTTEYSRVNYSWGGRYFFKNSSTSIPENLFVQWTGLNSEE